VIKEHRRTFKVVRLVSDLGLLTGVYYALYFSVLKLANPLGLVIVHPDYALRLPLILGVCWAAALLLTGAYDNTRLSGWGRALRVAGQALLLMLILFSMGVFAFKVQHLSRKFVFMYSGASLIGLFISKLLEIQLLQTLRRTGMNTISVLLVGEGETALQVFRQYQAHAEWGFRVLGILPTGSLPKAAKQSGLRVLGKPGALPEVLRTRIVDELVYCGAEKSQKTLAPVLAKAWESGKRVRMVLPSLAEAWHSSLDKVEGLEMLVLETGFSRPYQKLAKGLLEWLLTLGLVIALAPLYLGIALAIALTMGQPVMFFQKRAGKGGRAFFLYKFRTMVPGARALQSDLASDNIMGGPAFKLKKDPRITGLGRFLRRFSLDELPQLFNVLKGDMALVGPRPMAMYEARKVPAWARKRFSVRPGITCLWQVSGRNQLPFEEWMRLDLKYVDEQSLGLDAWILMKTPLAVLGSQGAY
jgi:exopolysaccharide biosynthesis polyprenyl glycosylphosphotransferase